MKKYILASALVVVGMTGCGQREEADVMRQSEAVVAEAKKDAESQPPAKPAPAVSMADEFAEIYQNAETAARQARELKYSWTSTAPLLEAASKAAEAGDYEKAMQLATEALLEAEIAIGQAEIQATTWKQAVVQ